MQRLQGPPAQENTWTAPSEVNQWFRGELGESVVVRWDQNPALWHQLNSPCLEEEECCLWPQEHHPHRQTGRWKHYALGVFFCWGDMTTAPHQRNDGRRHVPSGPGHWSQPGHWKWVVEGYSSMTMTQNTRPRLQSSGSRKSTVRSWSGLASLQNYIPLKICGGSWRIELPNISLETLMTWRGSAKWSGSKSLLRLTNTTNLVTNYKKPLTSVIANKY